MIETKFDVPFVAAMALREKQIQQNYRPIIAVHKWFARRPGTLFRALLLSEFGEECETLRESFFKSNDLSGIAIADPFMGGGTPLMEANRVGASIYGYDINPMAWWIVRQELSDLDIEEYQSVAQSIRDKLTKKIGRFYETRCTKDDRLVPVKYFLWVKVIDCPACNREHDISPGMLVAEDVRHPANVVACKACGDLNEVKALKTPGKCKACHVPLTLEGNVRRGVAECPYCGHSHKIAPKSPLQHRLFAIEYSNPDCAAEHNGRFFKKPDEEDFEKVREMERVAEKARFLFVPDNDIPSGDESSRLHRWGYRKYRELFNARQLVALDALCRLIYGVKNDRIREALATNLSDLLRYQNLLCRYDTMALKSLDIFSVHGFPVGLIACESNILGINHPRTGVKIGSGGWSNITEKYAIAKAYCHRPFETVHEGKKKIRIFTDDERISDLGRTVSIHCADAALHLKDARFDAVFTDPPYFGNVQYAELMDFCYVWLKQLLGDNVQEFSPSSTRSPHELTGNLTLGRGLEHFAEGLAKVFSSMSESLKPGGPLAFTFHHNELDAYGPIAMGILDAGLTCTAALPCPAEMGGSIHINGTGSSIVDTIFVCRHKGRVPPKQSKSESIFSATIKDLKMLEEGGRVPSQGDARCVIYGQMTMHVIRKLHKGWVKSIPTVEKLAMISAALNAAEDPNKLLRSIELMKAA